jgi:hypothetical protein
MVEAGGVGIFRGVENTQVIVPAPTGFEPATFCVTGRSFFQLTETPQRKRVLGSIPTAPTKNPDDSVALGCSTY